MYVYKIYIDYLIILISNMQIVTFLFCTPKWWAGEGDTYLNWAWSKGLGVGASLGEGAY